MHGWQKSVGEGLIDQGVHMHTPSLPSSEKRVKLQEEHIVLSEGSQLTH